MLEALLCLLVPQAALPPLGGECPSEDPLAAAEAVDAAAPALVLPALLCLLVLQAALPPLGGE